MYPLRAPSNPASLQVFSDPSRPLDGSSQGLGYPSVRAETYAEA
jgi:hypothetical protein